MCTGLFNDNQVCRRTKNAVVSHLGRLSSAFFKTNKLSCVPTAGTSSDSELAFNVRLTSSEKSRALRCCEKSNSSLFDFIRRSRTGFCQSDRHLRDVTLILIVDSHVQLLRRQILQLVDFLLRLALHVHSA